MSRRAAILAAVFLVALFAVGARAIVTPPVYTPVHLVEQSEWILVCRVRPGDKKGTYKLEVVRCLKGKKRIKPLPKLLVTTTMKKAWAARLAKLFSAKGGREVLIFSSHFNDDPGIAMNVDRNWVMLNRDKENPAQLKAESFRPQLMACWDGGTDMLLRQIELVIKFPDAPHAPISAGVTWDKELVLGKVPGRVGRVSALRLERRGPPVLHVPSTKGDRLFCFDPEAKKFADLTLVMKFSAKSHFSAWADLNGDAKLDVAWWDGKSLRINFRRADGTFRGPVIARAAPRGPCLGLAVCGGGAPGWTGLLFSTPKGPVLLDPDRPGGVHRPAIPPDELEHTGELGVCLVADFDNDSRSDLLQLGEKGGLFFRGLGPGRFARPRRSPVKLGEGGRHAEIGDFDGDGRLDVFCANKRLGLLWHNYEKGFAERFELSGEICYLLYPDVSSIASCDVNNDGRQDLVVGYARKADRFPQVFFNRGFRSFTKSYQLDLEERGIPEDEKLRKSIRKGQQAVTITDLNGDGAPDMTMVLADGTVVFFPREAFEDENPLGVRVRIPPGGAAAGPVRVTAWNSERCLGSWSVVPGGEALFGALEPGELKLRWQLPGGRPQERSVAVEDKPVDLFIEKSPKKR